MRRDDAIQILQEHRDALREFHVRSVAIFGSVARDEARGGSDVDILVEFDEDAHVGLFEFLRLQEFLESVLHATVDLVTPAALRQEMREAILKEAVHAA